MRPDTFIKLKHYTGNKREGILIKILGIGFRTISVI